MDWCRWTGPTFRAPSRSHCRAACTASTWPEPRGLPTASWSEPGTCIYVYTYVSVRACMNACICVYTYMCMYRCMYMYMYVLMFMFMCMFVRRVKLYVFACIYICLYLHFRTGPYLCLSLCLLTCFLLCIYATTFIDKARFDHVFPSGSRVYRYIYICTHTHTPEAI